MNLDHADLLRMNRVLRHRLRNFASGMKTTLSFLSKELEGRLAPSEMEYFPLISNECDGLTELTNRLNLLFENVPSEEEASVDAILDNVLTTVLQQVPTAGVRVEKAGATGAARVASKQFLVIALSEAVINALEAAPHKEVVLNVGVENGALKFLVSDDGPGISKQNAPNIFLPFFTTKARHLGIGLPLARKLVGGLGGEIRAESPEDGGCRVQIVLPPDESRKAEGAVFGKLPRNA